jgi:hypothetical protein
MMIISSNFVFLFLTVATIGYLPCSIVAMNNVPSSALPELGNYFLLIITLLSEELINPLKLINFSSRLHDS